MGVNEGNDRPFVSRTPQGRPQVHSTHMVLNKHEYGVNSLVSNSTAPFKAL